MAASESLRQLREEALKRHRAAGQKVSRLRRVNGVELGGTAFDPRVPPEDIRKMNTREVRRHLNNLNSFTARTNSFEAGRDMKPIPKANARRYRAAERANVALGQRQKAAVANVKLPSGKTVGEHMASQEQQEAMGTRRGTRAYMERPRASLRGVMSVAALDKITRSIERSNGPAYVNNHRRKTRQNMIDVLQGSGSSSTLVQAASKLTPYQADMLWNFHPSFARTAGEQYAFTVKNDGSDIRTTTSDADRETWQREQIEWASRLQEERPVAQGPRGRRR